jgi:hypothetical protein
MVWGYVPVPVAVPLYVNLQSLFRSLVDGMGYVTREHLGQLGAERNCVEL